MAVELNWIPYGGGNSMYQQIIRSNNVIAQVAPTINTYTDTGVPDNVAFEYQVANVCNVGGPITTDPISGVSWVCPTINIIESNSDLYVTVGALSAGYVTAVDLYDIKGDNIIRLGDPIPEPIQGRTHDQIFAGLDPGEYYTVVVTIITQDFNGNPDPRYTHSCTEQYLIPAPVVCASASNVNANPQY